MRTAPSAGCPLHRRKEPKQVAPNDNNGGSEDSKCVNRPPAPNPNTSGPQYSEYSTGWEVAV
ncbi:hypothetical protein ACFFX0_29260 [Citricoccus parietis]|uniref:Uncharacterized protein n=1 Tax=Citricoccus parietis TaxID=592307 RepID=A0ABV5G8V5_9MICC